MAFTGKVNYGNSLVGFMNNKFGPDLSRFPISRDFALPNFKCAVKDCVVNRNGECISPSLCEIGEDGRCKNAKLKKKKS